MSVKLFTLIIQVTLIMSIDFYSYLSFFNHCWNFVFFRPPKNDQKKKEIFWLKSSVPTIFWPKSKLRKSFHGIFDNRTKCSKILTTFLVVGNFNWADKKWNTKFSTISRRKFFLKIKKDISHGCRKFFLMTVSFFNIY